jgi:hypothetical protein
MSRGSTSASNGESNSGAEFCHPASDSAFGKSGRESPAPINPKPEAPRPNRESPETLKSDLTRSVARHHLYQCFVRREPRGPFGSPVFHLFGDDDHPLLVARNTSTLFSTRYRIIEPVGGEQLGSISSDWRSLTYSVVGFERFVISYSENFLGRHGARSFAVHFAGGAGYVVKPPIVIAGEYFQNFHDIEPLPSIKNFVLVDQHDLSREVVLVARISATTFTLRVSEPFSLLNAFAVALTSLHTGLFHR